MFANFLVKYITGCHKVKYFFSGKYFFCPFKSCIAFDAAVDSC